MTCDGLTPCDSDGVAWEFAWMPWVGFIDEQGKAQKVPTRGGWQQTPVGEWQVPHWVNDPDMPDEEAYGDIKQRLVPGRGKWLPDWEEGWVCNQRTGLWVVDVDDPEAFRRRMEILGIEPPRTRAQSTGRASGGMHLLYDGRDLPEQYWRQGGLGDPYWGDLKANGYVAAQGARHPRGPVYDWIPDSPAELVKPSLEFADMILAERALWKEALKDQNKGGGGATGRRNISSATGENRNVRLCALRGALFNRVPEMDDDEIEQALWAANEEFAEPLTDHEMRSTVLKPKPGWERHPNLIKPDTEKAIETFKQLYDLRESAGKFYARPADAGTPAIVTEIGDAFGRTIAAWWEDAAVAWNEMVKKRREEQAGEKAVSRAAEDEKRAALMADMTLDQQAEFVTKEQEALYAKAPKEPAEQSEEDSYAKAHPPKEQVNYILYHLEVAAARHDPVELHLRVMDTATRVVVDLCDSEARAVEITADGWRVCDIRDVGSSAWFRRSGSMLAQVIPVQPDDVVATFQAAQKILGLDDESWALALGAEIGWHFPGIDRPGEWLTGPSGSGKSTRALMLVNLIDPIKQLGGRIDVRRDERNARTRAMARYVMTTDNISEVSPELSDWWCQMHTGVADEVRKLHTDNEMLSYDYQRVGLATSLVLPSGLQPDALRRTLHVDLDASGKHPDKTSLWRDYEKLKPELLGAIYTVISGVLKHLPEVLAMELPGCPEMSDYARRLKAADLAFPKMVPASEPEEGQEKGPDLELYEAYSIHTGDIQLQRGADDPLARLVIEMMARLPRNEEGKLKDFRGTPTGLYKLLKTTAESHPGSENYVLSKKWPVDAIKMGEALTKLYAPLLRLGFDFKRAKSGSSRYYKITRVPVPDRDAQSSSEERSEQP